MPNFKEEEGERVADVAGTCPPPNVEARRMDGPARADLRVNPNRRPPPSGLPKFQSLDRQNPSILPGPSARGTSHCAAINHAALWE